ncbi:PAS domain-containing sensor histidine kinase [Schaedlerella arabinosiphila]|uniref:Circadian input-output histidine kinase CikA n=1 Tax=Schaedlerella arabinosiphila TaxID=2044587 RepID=A0A3R8L054_9FIRM|nr:PAS domain-containing hybrid sensor histidine kinase/response regulator [Schaedlerella arabinosiphila]RRK32158.1 PAS domain-containing sensor histidine kinase [Schaedlerella arabinosiphila]
MYHCNVHFYLAGHQRKVFEIIKGMSPLAHFTHVFSESIRPDPELAARADVILADLQDVDVLEAVPKLLSAKGSEAELILLADRDQILLLTDKLPEIKDIWTMPMSDEEIRFRFLRWQQTCKMSKDFWQTSHFFESTINNVPNLIWYKDKKGIHTKVNDSFCKTVNKTKEQVEGRGHAYIWDVDHDDPACIESELEVMNTKKTCISEETVKSGDGTRLLTTYKSPLYDIDGSVMGTVGVAIDVTQERAYEQEIVQKNHTLETIFTTMDCGVMTHSVDGSRILSVNRAALNILGYESQNELMDEGFDMVAASVIDEDKEMLRSSIRELKKEGDSVSVEYRVRHKDGKLLHIMGNVKLLKEKGESFYQRFLLDCTAQKLQEEKKERRHMELVQALSTDYNIVCFYDLDTDLGSSLRIDEGIRHIYGDIFTEAMSYRDSMEQYIQEFVYEEDRELMRQSFSQENVKKELSEKKSYYVNYRAIRGGEMRYFQLKIVRAGVWGEGHGIVLGLRSVDEEIRNEMEKKNLLQDALLQANRASKAKSVFLSNMSHDIRTPMNAIVGFTALAITHIDRPDQVEEYLKKIMTSGNHLLSLINDVLDMSRIESGKMHLDEKPCSLPDILHGLRSIVQSDIHAKQLELYIDTVDVLDEDIYCDKLRLNQVLLNLLSNAIKYTTAGGIISMRVMEKSKVTADYASYEFHIKDTGIGMSKEFVTHIFEPFEREKNSTISGIQGTGLGMAITKNIVDMMNGSIEVRSELGVGTEFIVSFTFRLHSGARKPQNIPELKNCRALVVDDDFNTCDSVSYMLGQIGMRAEWTLSGKEAVLRTRQAVMRGDDYCVYIIDWMLPDMNGVEVTRRIRKETGGNVPVIVLTAYDWADIEEEAKEAGVTAFCSKPLFFSELRSCLYSIVNTDEEEELEQEDTKQPEFRTGRILLAEDNELNQEIAEAILGDAGFEVEIAENGQIAVDMLNKVEPGYYQLVLMDVQMPVMNGYEATREVRSLDNPEIANIPILAMTANAFEEDKQAALRCGMNGHIAKPIDIDNLFGTLRQILK